MLEKLTLRPIGDCEQAGLREDLRSGMRKINVFLLPKSVYATRGRVCALPSTPQEEGENSCVNNEV